MKIDLTITYKGNEIDLDFSECEDIHDWLDLIVTELGHEMDSNFNGYYEVNQRPY